MLRRKEGDSSAANFPRDEKHSGGKRKLLRMLTASDNKRARLPIHGKTSKHHRALGLDRQPENEQETMYNLIVHTMY